MSEKKRFLLRLEPDLYAALERWSADELRSVNSQIEFLLKEAARTSGRLRPPGDGKGGRDPNRSR
jgi:hypothetical protein